MAEETPLRRFVRQFCASRIALIGVIVLAIIIIVAIAAPWIAPQNPYDLSKLDVLDSRLAPGEKAGDGMTFLLGSDDQGRDILSAILYGLRISVGVGAVSTVIALALGTVLGLIAGFAGGRIESLIMRIADLQLSFPPILLALILLALLLRTQLVPTPQAAPLLALAALVLALRSDAGYIGAMGSRRAQAKRRERLLAKGIDEADLERVSAPIGLDLGALTAEETALKGTDK